MRQQVLQHLRDAADSANGGDFCVIEYDTHPGMLGITPQQFGGYLTQLQQAGEIEISKVVVDGVEITQVAFP